jgi:hypothetical protein
VQEEGGDGHAPDGVEPRQLADLGAEGVYGRGVADEMVDGLLRSQGTGIGHNRSFRRDEKPAP